ncbi:SDR family oxidoreductase [Rhizobium sp. KVB221]|uniref:SDR family oxidoreductase n=1 Tax=Rhizobium setariae TaxID=2801340 RepID=A0A936YQ49_9HYPH|nr:SDR family oxidoreductase [Rhizobium setariae]MBL0370741.1 SDR family oxidoreductase [Rhizobium setariae]
MGSGQACFPDLNDTGVLITGGASGIGAALVKGFAAQGCRVAILDIDAKAGAATVAGCAEAKHTPVLEVVDLRDAAATRTAVERAAERLGGIKTVVNNAAWDDRRDIEAVTPDYWDMSLGINLRPAFFVTQAALPWLKLSGSGAVINFSSVAFMMNLPDMPAYLTAKAGIIGLTKGLAGKLGPDNIRVNAILPGMVLTERQKQLWVSDEAAEAHKARQCLKFSLTAEDMVGPCLFLASSISGAVSAQSLIVDGGYF